MTDWIKDISIFIRDIFDLIFLIFHKFHKDTFNWNKDIFICA